MNKINKYSRFQLVSPVMGSKIYKAPSLNQGSYKCYQELKAASISDWKEFAVMDVDTYEIFKFSRKNKLSGGEIKPPIVPKHTLNGSTNTNVNPSLEQRVAQLEQSVKDIQNKFLMAKNNEIK